jgi:DNA replicative helicase MCM subunit Mcm2 (Cdc46/Mcm family)
VVVKVQQMRLMATEMEFNCFECKSNFRHYFVDGIYSLPAKCLGKKACKSKTFVPLKDKMKTIFAQRIKIQ